MGLRGIRSSIALTLALAACGTADTTPAPIGLTMERTAVLAIRGGTPTPVGRARLVESGDAVLYVQEAGVGESGQIEVFYARLDANGAPLDAGLARLTRGLALPTNARILGVEAVTALPAGGWALALRGENLAGDGVTTAVVVLAADGGTSLTHALDGDWLAAAPDGDGLRVLLRGSGVDGAPAGAASGGWCGPDGIACRLFMRRLAPDGTVSTRSRLPLADDSAVVAAAAGDDGELVVTPDVAFWLGTDGALLGYVAAPTGTPLTAVAMHGAYVVLTEDGTGYRLWALDTATGSASSVASPSAAGLELYATADGFALRGSDPAGAHFETRYDRRARVVSSSSLDAPVGLAFPTAISFPRAVVVARLPPATDADFVATGTLDHGPVGRIEVPRNRHGGDHVQLALAADGSGGLVVWTAGTMTSARFDASGHIGPATELTTGDGPIAVRASASGYRLLSGAGVRLFDAGGAPVGFVAAPSALFGGDVGDHGGLLTTGSTTLVPVDASGVVTGPTLGNASSPFCDDEGTCLVTRLPTPGLVRVDAATGTVLDAPLRFDGGVHGTCGASCWRASDARGAYHIVVEDGTLVLRDVPRDAWAPWATATRDPETFVAFDAPYVSRGVISAAPGCLALRDAQFVALPGTPVFCPAGASWKGVAVQDAGDAVWVAGASSGYTLRDDGALALSKVTVLFAPAP